MSRPNKVPLQLVSIVFNSGYVQFRIKQLTFLIKVDRTWSINGIHTGIVRTDPFCRSIGAHPTNTIAWYSLGQEQSRLGSVTCVLHSLAFWTRRCALREQKSYCW